MKQKLLNKLWLRVGMIVAIMTTALSGTAWATSDIYVFNTLNWGDSSSEWTSGQGGNQFTSGRGVQVTTGKTGANATTKSSFPNVSEVVVTYSTNASTGAGSISIQVGSNTAVSQNVTKTGGTSDRTLTYSFSPAQTGAVKIAVTCTTNSIYVKSVKITYTSGGDTPTPTTYTVTYDANGGTGTMTDDDSPYESGATVTVLDNEFTRTDYDFTGWNTAADGSGTGYDEGDTFTINANTTLFAQWEEQASESGNVTLTQSNLGLTGSYTTDTEKTIGGITYVFTDLMKSNENIQAKASSGTIKNTTAYPGDITSVAITHSSTARATTINGSADGKNWTQVATGSGSITADFAGKGYKYFQITRGSNAAYWEKIEITYSTSSNPVCAMPTFNPTEGTYTSAQSVTISTATAGATIYYTTDSSEPTTNSSVYSSAIPVNNTTTIKAIAVADGYDNSSVASATYTIVPLEHAGTQADPYTVADAFTAIDANAGITDVYVSGIVCTAANSLTNNKYLTYYISDDGTTTNKLEAYHGLGIGGADFTSADDIQVGDKVVIYGNLKKYNSTYEFDADNQLVSIVHPASITVASTTIDASYAVYNGTINITYENFTPALSEVIFCDANGGDATYDWITAVINNENNVEYHLNENTGEARTAYMKVYALDDEANDVYSDLITINQAAAPVTPPTPVSGKYVKVTSTDDLTDGQYLIVYEEGSVAFDGGLETLDAVGNTIAVTISNNEIAATSTTTAAEFTIDVTAGTIKSASGEYIFASTYNNELKTSTSVPEKTNTFSFNSGDAVISVSVTETQSVTLRYNSASNQTRFRYYKSGQEAIQLYKKVVPTESVKLNASGYATFSSNNAVSIPADGAFTAWQITNIDSDNKITFVQVTGNVKAGTGLFLKGDENDEITIETAASGAELQDNILVGFPNATNVNDGEYYGLSGNQFVKVTAGIVKAGKALLPAGYITESNSVKPFTFVFEDDATGIEETLSNSPLKGENIYNLAGQMVNGKSVNGKLPKGIYIVNGKKVMVK